MVNSGDHKQWFIKYKSSQQSADFNSSVNERNIKLVEIPLDPLNPPKFKYKRAPRASGSPPVPVMQSPPRQVSVKDQQDWKIPPCVTNWKNPKGYAIPLDKRLAAGDCVIREVRVNDGFAMLSEALHVTEGQAREAVSLRSEVRKEVMMKEKKRKEENMRALANKTRSKRNNTMPYCEWDPPRETKEEREERAQREKIREERSKERGRERRLEAKDESARKISKTGFEDRDISEKVALGMASGGSAQAGEVMYDKRLFNQERGMDSGFGSGDQYNVYDKGLFIVQPTLTTLYRPKKDGDHEMYGGADERVKLDKGFTGAGNKGSFRDGLVEFEREAVEDADYLVWTSL